jgi:predicted amidohydrolase YtcJ
MTDQHKQGLRAAFIAPMDAPMLRDAAVVFDAGTIIARGETSAIRSVHPDAELRDLGDVVLLPGLVNAHTHLELSAAECGSSPGGSFTDWIIAVREQARISAANRAMSRRQRISALSSVFDSV